MSLATSAVDSRAFGSNVADLAGDDVGALVDVMLLGDGAHGDPHPREPGRLPRSRVPGATGGRDEAPGRPRPDGAS